MKKKYYNCDQLLSRHFNINFICGDRFDGKSTCFQKYCIKRAIHTDKQFAIVVRYDIDIDTLCKTYFDNTMEMFYPDYKLYFAKKKFFLIDKRIKDCKPKLVGYGFALNKATSLKSTSYPHINTIVMEEFMNLEGKYIKSKANPELEVELLISLFSTIARGNHKQFRDDVRVFCISNNFFLNNPYFRYFNLIEKITKNPFQRFYIKNTKPKCIVEITHNNINLDIGRDDVNKGSKFIDMQNELKIINKPKVNKVAFQISFDNREFLNIADYNDSSIVFSNGSTVRNDCKVFSCSDIQKKGIYSIQALKRDKAYDILTECFEKNWLYYDKLESYITLYNILHF